VAFVAFESGRAAGNTIAKILAFSSFFRDTAVPGSSGTSALNMLATRSRVLFCIYPYGKTPWRTVVLAAVATSVIAAWRWRDFC
jgi:hypothetical protein